MAALIALGRQIVQRLAPALFVGSVAGTALELATPSIDIFPGFGGGGGNGLKKRRRRRRALTADDMRTALTISSAISKKAAENFILQRVRAS